MFFSSSPKKERHLLFAVLSKKIKLEDFSAIVKTCDGILKDLPNDEDALRTKLVALVNLNEFDQVLKTLDSLEDSSDYVFERSYALYRLRRDTEALELLGGLSASQKSPAIQHVEAQLLYRSSKPSSSIDIYESFNPIKSKDLELHTNTIAAYVAANAPERGQALVKSLLKQNPAAHELPFNIASLMLQTGNFEDALEQLSHAKSLGEQMLQDDGASEDEITSEMAMILTQEAYIHQLQGQMDEALERYQSALANKPSDESVVATACNNIITLRPNEEKVFDSQKKLQKALSMPLTKLSVVQLETIRSNFSLISVYTKQPENCRKQCNLLLKEDPTREFPNLVLAYLLQREKKTASAIKLLAETYEQHASRDSPMLSLQLALATLQLSQGKQEAAVATLQGFGSKSDAGLIHRPGVVATIACLQERMGDVKGAASTHERAADYWQQKGDKELETLLREKCAAQYLKSDVAESVKAYKRLLVGCSRSDPRRSFYLGKLVTASTQGGLDCDVYMKELSALAEKQIERTEYSLGDLDPLSVGLQKSRQKSRRGQSAAGGGGIAEYNAGEAANVAVDRVKSFRAAESGEKKKKKKKKKPRFPKGYDPENPKATPKPDPERWLPRWERSTFKKGKRKAKRNQNRETTGGQGSATRLLDQTEIDLVDGPSSPAAKPQQEAPEKKKVIPSGSRNKNKKKKKRR